MGHVGQLAALFKSAKANIREHIRNVIAEGAVDPAATAREFRTVRQEGSRQVSRALKYYNPGHDPIGRIPAEEQGRHSVPHLGDRTPARVPRQGLHHGRRKLKNFGGGTYWRELLDRIRAIRSSEKVLYPQVLDLYATSIDYTPQASETVEFFKIIQDKLHMAAHPC